MISDKKSLVSVIINCFNSERYISESITSVLEQTYDNIELIIIDNCSTDRTADLIHSFNDDRILYHKTSYKCELSDARNIALDLSNGEYISFIDSAVRNRECLECTGRCRLKSRII